MTKEEIIKEIKRTALENGGQALGRNKFSKETEITPYEWGKYWPIWSEAVREAGFEPNQMHVGYKEKLLIEKLVDLTRECKRKGRSFPTANDIRKRSFEDSNFPSKNAFVRLGLQRQRIQKVLEYCRNKSGFEDVILMCEETINKTSFENRKIVEEETNSDEEFGFVYLIKTPDGFYKIGLTKANSEANAVSRRVHELASLSGEDPNLVHTIKTDDPIGVEKYWHTRFEEKHKRREVFKLYIAS